MGFVVLEDMTKVSQVLRLLRWKLRNNILLSYQTTLIFTSLIKRRIILNI